MSLDFTLWQRVMTPVHDSNMTHNLAEMAQQAGIYHCLWRPDENGINRASQLIPLLRDAVKEMELNPDHYRQFDSPNGWGKFDAFLPWVKSILKACEEHPDR